MKLRLWKIYGDWFHHPNGYVLKNILTLGFESGPNLRKGEKVDVVETEPLLSELKAVREILDIYIDARDYARATDLAAPDKALIRIDHLIKELEG